MSIPRIALTGPFADVNFGDYAMLVNNIYDIDIRNVTIFSYDNEFLEKIKKDYLQKYDIRIVEVELDNEKICVNGGYITTPIEVISGVINYDEVLEYIKDIDVLIVNGGGYFNSLWSQPHRITRLLKIIAPIYAANQLNKKIIFTGNSYGPFDQDAEFFASLFNSLKNSTFGCRDDFYSPMRARQLGIKDSDIKRIPDDLLLINDRILKHKKNISIKSKNYIVMETYLPIEYIEKNKESFIKFSNTMYDKYGLDIVFLPLNIDNGGLKQAKYIAEFLDHYEYVDISSNGYLPIQDAVEVIKNAKLVVSSRYHALVVALSTMTPTISVLKDVMGDKRYYYNKNNGVLRLVFDGIDYDERYYLGLDYLESLNFISNNFREIVDQQLLNYNSEQYIQNIELLSKKRINYFDRIKDLKNGNI